MVAINPQAASFLLTGDGDTACLFIHGFTASPSEVYPVARLLYEMMGCTVSGPLLPGHGTSPEDMNQTGWQDWFVRVEQEIDYLRRRHTRVFVAGLSMGALLALHAAAKQPDLKGVIAINTPIITTSSPWLKAITPLMQYMRPYYPKEIKRDTEELQTQGRFAYPVMPVKAYISMGKLNKMVVQELPRLNIPMLLFQSRHDDSVDSKSAKFIQDQASQGQVRLIFLPESGHIATMGPEKNLIADEIAEFIK